MKLIFRERDTQKARQLFEEAEGLMANDEKVIIITPNARALRVKAESYGFNLNIIEPEEVNIETVSNSSIILHNVDKLIESYFNKNFIASNVIAMSATLMEKE